MSYVLCLMSYVSTKSCISFPLSLVCRVNFYIWVGQPISPIVEIKRQEVSTINWPIQKCIMRTVVFFSILECGVVYYCVK